MFLGHISTFLKLRMQRLKISKNLFTCLVLFVHLYSRELLTFSIKYGNRCTLLHNCRPNQGKHPGKGGAINLSVTFWRRLRIWMIYFEDYDLWRSVQFVPRRNLSITTLDLKVVFFIVPRTRTATSAAVFSSCSAKTASRASNSASRRLPPPPPPEQTRTLRSTHRRKPGRRRRLMISPTGKLRTGARRRWRRRWASLWRWDGCSAGCPSGWRTHCAGSRLCVPKYSVHVR